MTVLYVGGSLNIGYISFLPLLSPQISTNTQLVYWKREYFSCPFLFLSMGSGMGYHNGQGQMTTQQTGKAFWMIAHQNHIWGSLLWKRIGIGQTSSVLSSIRRMALGSFKQVCVTENGKVSWVFSWFLFSLPSNAVDENLNV